jgi:hypothetical protein
MVRFAVTGAVVALLALMGCGGARQEREKKEQQAEAAEKKLVDGRAFLEGLEREKKLLTTQLTEANARLADSRALHRRTLAGAAFLASKQGNGLVLDADMSAARDGFLLEEAARGKNREAIGALADRALGDVGPCLSEATQDQDGACPPCEVAPYEDTCVGVETNLAASPDWSCATLARTGEGLPPAAFCTSVLEHPAPASGVESPYAEKALDTSLQVVRVAFVHQGKLQVSDYPAPKPSLYNPPNVGPLAACKAETDRNRCIHECKVAYGRYEDPCACEQPDAAPEAPSEDEEPEGYEEEESPEQREAREAAAEAEAEAREAEEARREAEYPQCLASCEPEEEAEEQASPSDSAAEGTPEPPPTSTVVTARLEATPAPGVFVVSRELQVLRAQKEVAEVAPLTLVLKHSGLVALWQKKALPGEEALGALEEVGRVDTVMKEAGKPAIVPLPGVEGPVLVGLLEGRVKAYAFTTQPGREPVVALEPAVVCEAVRAEPKRFPQEVQDACARLAASATGEADAGTAEALVDAGAPEVTVDAGGPREATDAGTAGTPGEVSP